MSTRFLCLCLLTAPLVLASPTSALAEEQCVFSSEAFAFKKIVEFWKDGDKEMTQKHIISFLEKYKNTILSDKLYAMLGDIYFEKNSYQEAFLTYSKISADEFKTKTFANRVHALFMLGQYQHLVEIARPVLQTQNSVSAQLHHFFAQSLYYLALQSKDPNLQLSLLKEAQPHFVALENTPFADTALLPIAETHRLLKEYSWASTCYLALAQKNPLKKEQFLFQAALAKKQYDAEGAKAIFAEVAKEGKDPFMVGVSLTAIEAYEKAIPHLNVFVSARQGNAVEFKIALYDLLLCAQKTNNLALFEKSFDTWNSLYSTSSASPEQETLRYQHCLLLFKHLQWGKSRTEFLSFVADYPSSSLCQAAWRTILQCTLKENNQEHLAADLKAILAQNGVFQSNEELPMRFLLAKTLYDLQRYQEALVQCQALDLSTVDAQFLFALCVQKTTNDPRAFIAEAEKALTLAPFVSSEQDIRLCLFNAYIALPDAKAADYHSAAEHLWHCSEAPDSAISTDNQLWLSNYYFEQARDKHQDNATSLQRATFLFEKLVTTTLSTAPLIKETAALKLAELYTLANLPQKRVDLLSTLAEEQKKNPDVAWKLQRRVLFELALSYELAHEEEKALQLYDLLTRSSTPSYVSKAAILHGSKLRFGMLTNKDKNTPELQEILSALKDLQIKKKAESEPLHLEAGLAYAEICTQVAESDQKAEKELFYLKRLKEDFTSPSDILSKEYHSRLEANPDKSTLFQNYMQFIDAEIARLEAQSAENNDQAEMAEQLKKQATALLTPLKQNSSSLSPYLSERLKK